MKGFKNYNDFHTYNKNCLPCGDNGCHNFHTWPKENSVMLYIIHNSCKTFETVLDRKEGPGKILVRRMNIINKTTT